MRLVVYLDPCPIEFTEPLSGGEYPWLTKVGTLMLAARAGHLDGIGVGEGANIEVELDNAGRQATTLLGYPLRAPADVYDDDDELLLSGLVARFTPARAVSMTIEA